MKKYFLAAALSALAGQAAAQFHVGAQVGASNLKLNCADTISCDRSDVGFKFFAGYRFHPILAAEVGYIDFGRARATYPQSGFIVESDLEAQALTAAAVARVELLPSLVPSLTGVARLGLAAVHTERENRAAGARVALSTTDQLQPYVGLGLSYSLRKNVQAEVSVDMTRAEVESASGNSKGVARLISAGLTYSF